jgi:hypothetical protein
MRSIDPHMSTMHMGGTTMQAMEIQEHARKLRDTHGEKAALEAAQKAKSFEQQGDAEQAKTWRRIEKALLQMQGPHVS